MVLESQLSHKIVNILFTITDDGFVGELTFKFTGAQPSVTTYDVALKVLQEYLAHKKRPPPQDYHRALGIGLL